MLRGISVHGNRFYRTEGDSFMSVQYRNIALICFFLVLAMTVGCGRDPASDSKATVLSVTGRVEVRASSTTSFTAARASDAFGNGGAIRTAEESLADLSINGRGIVKLRPDTYFELNVGNGNFAQNTGTAIYEIDKGDDVFRIKSPQCTTSVLGTRFMVKIIDNMTVVGVEEGRVEITANDGKSKIIEAKQQLSVADSGFVNEPVSFDMINDSLNYRKVNDSWVPDN